MKALDAQPSIVAGLPRRVVLFGASHIPQQGLEALAAMSAHTQVLFAIPNPSRYHWADIIEGREVLARVRHRHGPREGEARDLSEVPLDAMHAHAHPLLAAWGRQGRDFMQLLDAFDDAEAMKARFGLPRIDLFDEGTGVTLLQQVQASIRDLLPLHEHPHAGVASTDRSIVFHVTHGVQREVEVLHDQLLTLLAEPASVDDAKLRPRDIVVMVPDIEAFAPSIRAVFGQFERSDARYIPFDIADLRSRGSNPLVVAFEWLLRLPEKRVRLQEVRDLLDVPGVARRSGIEPETLPGLFAWLEGAGVRWGLHEAQRSTLGLGAAGEQNSWLFGIRRMLLGYASGSAATFEGIDPYDEIGGLEAPAVGSLIDLFERLERWWAIASTDAQPSEWAARGRALLDAFVDASDERERLTIAALQSALSTWLEACETARFDEAVPLSIVREAWLAGIDGLDANRRFLTGGVTFCTLMPLRAVPFEVVCLLGMNDGDFPRTSRASDFDLMALPGQQRPGDRSRRDDDRYLMLEALLSARRVLYMSWCGRSARDNVAQPPSVLVAQLREYLKAGWNVDVLADRTVEHPLQPFSRRYFEADGLTTYAREWRAAHNVSVIDTKTSTLSSTQVDEDAMLSVQELVRFLRNPVREFFRARLDVRIADEDGSPEDDEAFALKGLDQYAVRAELLRDPQAALRDGVETMIARRIEHVRGSGRLPLFELGARAIDAMKDEVTPMLARWVELQHAYPHTSPKRALRFEHHAVALDDWFDGLRSDGTIEVKIAMAPSKMLDAGDVLQPRKLLDAWVRMLAASACGHGMYTFLIGSDAMVGLAPLEQSAAASALRELLSTWRDGMTTPLPFAIKTALAFVADEHGRSAALQYEGSYNVPQGECDEFGLRKLFPDYRALTEDGRFATHARRLAGPLLEWSRSSSTIIAHGEVFTTVDASKVVQ
jgi:exodeoxyribonuclease V gamma subunit